METQLMLITCLPPKEMPKDWLGNYVHVDLTCCYDLNDGYSRVLIPPNSWNPSPSSFWLWENWILGINTEFINAIDFPKEFNVDYCKVDLVEYVREAQDTEYNGSRNQDIRSRMEIVFKKGDQNILATIFRIHDAHKFHRENALRFIYPQPIYFGGRMNYEISNDKKMLSLIDKVDTEIEKSLITNEKIETYVKDSSSQGKPPNGSAILNIKGR
ncbi:hypothetical protein [Ekhidna sp.]|uniref:hypothetical protein n=1 Tax=Ekhidna sp. TaxID=2608089 RepID=UPI003BA9DE0F